MNTTSSAVSQSLDTLPRDASVPKLTRQGESSKKFLITTELEWSKHTELITPKQRTNFDSKVAKMVHSKSRTMSPMERGTGRPYTSPKKTHVQVNVISDTPIDRTSRFYDEVDLIVHKKFAEAKHITEKSTTHISNLFKSMEMVAEVHKYKVTIDQTTIRPTSAYSPGESFSRAAKNLQKDIDFIKSHGNRSLHLPPWNDQFIHGKALTPRVLAPVAPIHQAHSDFVKSMGKYKVLASPGSSLLDDYPCRSPDQSKALVQSTLTLDSSFNNTVVLANSMSTSSLQHEPDAMAQTIPPNQDVTSDQYDTVSSDDNGNQRAHEIWHNLVNNLHNFGNDIIYNDLFEFSILREPPAIVSKYLGYMAVLMGLKPDWSTVRSTLLKENKIFLNFVVEVRKQCIYLDN
ncbi:hypothetical protein EON65_10565 [archaeon]|nr:MAG: hypothetical protein EON65_10565 [archaeon]